MGVAYGPLGRRRSGKGCAVPEGPPVYPPVLADQSGGIVMNTAMDSRLAWATASSGSAKTIISPADRARLPASLLIRLRCFGRAKPRGAIAAHNCTTFDMRSSFANSMESESEPSSREIVKFRDGLHEALHPESAHCR